MFLILQKQVCFQSYEILLVIYNKVLMKRLLNQCCTPIQAIKKPLNLCSDTLGSK